MYLTGIADEASQQIEVQIETTRKLGWNAIEARSIDGQNIHDIPEENFDRVCAALAGSGVHINAFGSAIANWGKDVADDFAITEAEIARAIPRMQRLGVKMVRIMSYRVVEGRDLQARERIRRLRHIVEAFAAAGITALHENCMNYGGLSCHHTLDLLEAVPGMQLVFDTGNPVFNRDRSKPGMPWQDPLEFYHAVREHIAYVHIKDCLHPGSDINDKETYTYPGEGQARVREILADLKERGYDGGISIEPHLAAVFHDADSPNANAGDPVEIYLEYGRRLMRLLAEIGYQHSPYQPLSPEP